MPDLWPEQIQRFTPIIDDSLELADLNTITPKRIILGLQEKLGYDIAELKVHSVPTRPISALRAFSRQKRMLTPHRKKSRN